MPLPLARPCSTSCVARSRTNTNGAQSIAGAGIARSAGSTVPDRLAAILEACRDGGLPPNIALMRGLIEAGSREEAEAVIADARASADPRLKALAGLFAANPQSWTTIRSVMAQAEHDRL